MHYLVEGQPLKSTVQPFDIQYFKWFNTKAQDVKVTISVKHGLVDLYVSTIDENKNDQNLVQRIPSSKRNTIWLVENIMPTSSVVQNELLIMNTDRNYCTKCTYLIGVVSHEKKADFGILL